MAKALINDGFRVGILGGGQLGKMLALAAQNWELTTWILDASSEFPAAQVCDHFVAGNFKDYDDVYNFGKQVDVLTIEIEHVNTDALLQLEKEGVIVHPSPAALTTIKDKGLQKLFYQAHDLPTSPFQLLDDAAAIKQAIQDGQLQLPFVQKSRTAGYDGKGVAIIRTEADLDNLLMDAPSMIEPLVDIDKELAVIVARNPSGDIQAFPPVEMEFNPTANLVEFLFCPANISTEVADRATQIARQVIEDFNICGLLAVEFFLTNDGEVLINEVAPRPHNSGHHTIDSAITSQFQQHLRAIVDLPLGATDALVPAVMVNLLGAPEHTGPAHYEGLSECIAQPGTHFHIYGKTVTKPFRKMGHATVVDQDLEAAKTKARYINEHLRIVSKEA